MEVVESIKTGRVRDLFDKTDWWVRGWQCPIRIRSLAVREFVGARQFDSVIDIGCGDGSLTTQLLSTANHLTLLDISEAMLTVAHDKIPSQLQDRVTYINADVEVVDLPLHAYDLVVCVGVFAHVESPARLIERICNLLRPGGLVITECTDAGHIISKFGHLRDDLRELVRSPSYYLNRITPERLNLEFSRRGLTLVQTYRHAFRLAGVSSFLSADRNVRLLRRVFGSVRNNRNLWLGNQCLLTFQLGNG